MWVRQLTVGRIGKNLTSGIFYGALISILTYLLVLAARDSLFFHNSFINYYNIFTIYLIAIIISTLRFGFISGLTSAIFSFVIINFIYLIQSSHDLSIISLAVNFLLFIGVSIALSINNNYSNFHKIGNITKHRALKVINKITQAILSASNIDELAMVICKKSEDDLHGKFSLGLLESEDKITFYNEEHLDELWREKIRDILYNPVPQTVCTANKTIYFQPMTVGDKVIGVLVAQINPYDDFIFNLEKILPVICDQIAITLNNFRIKILLHESRITQEREQLRSLILSSISHDLKTPLASIIGGLSIFKTLSAKNKLTKQNQKTLISTALNEAERLNGFISDVLEMTRIESGAVKLQKQFFSPHTIIEKTLKRFKLKLKDYKVEVIMDKEIKINFDLISFEQVMQNLVDNTIKYSSKDTKISIYDELKAGVYRIFIRDEGRGIESTKLNLIFNKFERFAYKDQVASGSGLGLSIVKALMEVNNASIMAKNAEEGERGAIFILTFQDFKKSIQLKNL